MVSNLALRNAQKTYTRKEKRDWLDELADWSALTEALKEALRPLLGALMLETVRQAFIDLGANPDDFDAAEAAVESYPGERSAKVALAINEETTKQLRAEMSQAVDAAEDDAHIMARIDKVFGAALTYRASRAASTEIVHTQNFADIQAWKQSGLVDAKEWYTAEDELVCPFCSSLDGAIMPLDDAFFRQGDTISAGGEKMRVGFGDIQGAPLHVSCRCYMLDVRIKAT